MTNAMQLCATCHRHYFTHDEACPFCSREGTPTRPRGPLAVGLAAGIALALCASPENAYGNPVPRTAPPDSVPIPAYGIPPRFPYPPPPVPPPNPPDAGVQPAPSHHASASHDAGTSHAHHTSHPK